MGVDDFKDQKALVQMLRQIDSEGLNYEGFNREFYVIL